LLLPVAESFHPEQAGHRRGMNMTAWVKAAERTPLAYIQHGHDNAPPGPMFTSSG
jgi:hypothetical protein